LLRALEREAPGIRIVAIPVQFRSVAAELASGLAAAITVADQLPATIRRERLFYGGFTCLYDPRHAKLRTLTEAEYFAHDHVVVSYNGDLRGIVEDLYGKARKVRCSVSSFANIGALVDGSAMLATIPELVAVKILATRPHLKTKPLPPTLKIEGSHAELLWPAVTDDDGPCKFVRAKIREIARAVTGTRRPLAR
jgi:LysR family transcriptional activator of mexEF-oprN operon